MNLSISKLVLCGIACCSAFAAAQTPYRMLDQWKIGGDGGWDYLVSDAAAHRLYLTHNARVEVVDTRTGKLIGAIAGLKSTHGVALDPDGVTGYISDGAGNSVVLFDRGTLAKLATIPAGTNPDAILYEPSTRGVWAFNGRSNNVSVIDTQTRTVVATIALPGKPEFAQADGRGSIYVNLEDKNSVVRLNAAKRAVTAMWPIQGCEAPSGLALDQEHHRLFAVCDGKKMGVIDATDGHEITLAEIGNSPDAVAYSAREQLAFSSNGDGTLTVIDARNDYKTLQTLSTRKGARTLAYDAAADRIYLSTADYGPRPGATAGNPKPRPVIVPGSFTVLVVGRK